MEELILAAVYGLGLGVVAGSALAMTSPFAREDAPRWEAMTLLAALVILCVAGGVYVLDAWEALGVVAAAAAPGGALFWLWDRGQPQGEPSDLTWPLTLADIRRPKTPDDCWVLVTGPRSSGKTTLVERVASEALPRLAAPPRYGKDGDVRVAELPFRAAAGRVRILRLWECGWDGGASSAPVAQNLDGVVLVIDPTCAQSTAGTFPEALKAGPSVADFNTQAIALDASLAKAGRTVDAWHVITKADMVRFSIDASLVKLVKAGTGWYEQLRGFDIVDRRDLAGRLGIDTSERAALRQGQGSPFLAYAGRDAAGSGSFGAGNLLRAISDTLMEDVRLERGGTYAR